MTIRNCVVPKCGSTSTNKKGEDIRFHQIPKRSFFEWLDVLQLKEVKSINDIIYVCSKHFKPEDYTDPAVSRVMLKPGVVPTIGIPNNNSNTSFNIFNDEAIYSITIGDSQSQSCIPPSKDAINEIDSEELRNALHPIIENILPNDTSQPVQNPTPANQPSEISTEQTKNVQHTNDQEFIVKEITNQKNPDKKEIFVTRGTTEYTMTAKSMRKMCRICFSTENLSCMFTTTYKDVKMCDIVAKLTKRSVPQGRLSQNICLRCIKSLGQLHKFSETCRISENLIRLCHRIFFGSDMSSFDENESIVVTPGPSQAYRIHAPNKRKADGSIVNSQPANKGLSRAKMIDVSSFRNSEHNYMKRQEEWNENSIAKQIDSSSKKPKCDYSIYRDLISQTKAKTIKKPIAFNLKNDENNIEVHIADVTTPKQYINKKAQISATNTKDENGEKTNDSGLSSKQVEDHLKIVEPVSIKAIVATEKSIDAELPTTETILATCLSSAVAKPNILRKVPLSEQIKPTVSITIPLMSTKPTTEEDILRVVPTAKTDNSNNSKIRPNTGVSIQCLEPNCEKVFSSLLALTNHNLNMHVISHCDVCDSNYMGQRRLKIHFFKVHSLGTSFKCNVCHSVFGKSDTYLKHRKDCKTSLVT